MKKFCTYVRVSTLGQEENGISLEAQSETCRRYVESQGGEIIGEFRDIASGSKRERPGLMAAVKTTKEIGATLVLSMFDRLTRNLEHAIAIRNSGIDIYFCDAPHIGRLEFGVRALVAEEERERIRERTKAGLAQRTKHLAELGEFRARSGRICKKLGNPDYEPALELAQAAAAHKKAVERCANENWAKSRRIADRMRKAGASLREITDTLNANEHTTSTGGRWHLGSVGRMLRQPLVSELEKQLPI
jgi:DNA invertase Pin-like site-specific DNA recombinase